MESQLDLGEIARIEVELDGPSKLTDYRGLLPYMVLTMSNAMENDDFVIEIERALLRIPGVEVVWSFRVNESNAMKIYLHDKTVEDWVTAVVSPLIEVLEQRRAMMGHLEAVHELVRDMQSGRR